MREWLAVQRHVFGSRVLCWFQIAAFNHVCGSIWYQSCTLGLPRAPLSPNVFLLSHPISCHLKWLLSCVKTERESRVSWETSHCDITVSRYWQLMWHPCTPVNQREWVQMGRTNAETPFAWNIRECKCVWLHCKKISCESCRNNLLE